MTCPDVGLLRAWIDGEAGASASELAGHLVACAACRAHVEELRAHAGAAGAAIRSLAPPVSPSAAALTLAYQRVALSRGGVVEGTVDQELALMALTRRVTRWRPITAGIAAALALAFLLGTSDGRTATASFLAQFRSETIVPIAVDSSVRSPFGSLGQLDRLGTVQGARSPKAEDVSSLADAGRRVGFAVKQPDPATLPAGLAKTPKIQVVPAHEIRFTFDEAKARQYFQEIGRSNVVLPAKFNGATLVVSIPSAAALEYLDPTQTGQKTPSSGLIVGQSKEITAGVEGGVSLDEMRDFLLGLPGLPPDAVRQLRSIQDWRTTLPLPVPVDRMTWRQTTVAGGPGLVLSDNSGLGSAALWQRDGRVYGVGGTYKATDVQRVADSLR